MSDERKIRVCYTSRKSNGGDKKMNAKKEEHTLWKRIKKNKLLYLFLLPAVLVITIFKYYPFLTSVYQSFFNWNGANVHLFNAVQNYIDLFLDKSFRSSFVNIIVVCIATVCINLTLPFLAAEIVTNLKSVRKQNFFKMGFIIPMVVPSMVVILLWKWILAGDYGVLNMLLEAVGLDHLVTPWLATSRTALGSIIAINFPWIAGLPFLLYLAGRQNISEDLYEAAEIEGAGRLKKIIYIDIPLLASQRKLVITYMLIQAFQMFDQPYVLTSGGPGTSTLTPALYIYQRAFNYNQFGYSAAVGVVLFLFVMLVTVINQKFMKDSDNMG